MFTVFTIFTTYSLCSYCIIIIIIIIIIVDILCISMKASELKVSNNNFLLNTAKNLRESCIPTCCGC